MFHGEAGSHLSASRSFQTQYSGQPGRPTAQTQSSLFIAPLHYVEFQLFAGFLTRQIDYHPLGEPSFHSCDFQFAASSPPQKLSETSFFKRSFSGACWDLISAGIPVEKPDSNPSGKLWVIVTFCKNMLKREALARNRWGRIEKHARKLRINNQVLRLQPRPEKSQ